jgi:hypothetical protein
MGAFQTKTCRQLLIEVVGDGFWLTDGRVARTSEFTAHSNAMRSIQESICSRKKRRASFPHKICIKRRSGLRHSHTGTS